MEPSLRVDDVGQTAGRPCHACPRVACRIRNTLRTIEYTFQSSACWLLPVAGRDVSAACRTLMLRAQAAPKPLSVTLAGGYRSGDRVTASFSQDRVAVGNAGTVIGPATSGVGADQAQRVLVEFDGGKGQMNCIASSQLSLVRLAGGYRSGDRVTASFSHDRVAVGNAGTVIGPATSGVGADQAQRVLVEFDGGKGQMNCIASSQLSPFRRHRARRARAVNPQRLRFVRHMPHALVERCGLRRASRLAFTPLASHAADARRRGVRHCAPALQPHRTNPISMRARRAIVARDFFRPFRTPKLGGSWPSRGFAVLPFLLVWQAKKAAANKKAAEEAAQVRFSRWMHWVPPSHCERHDAHASSGSNVFIHTGVRCLGPPPCDCPCACVRCGLGDSGAFALL